MTFSESIRTCFGKFITWEGRAARSEYWYFVLFCILCQIAAGIVDNVLGTGFKMMNPATGLEQSIGYGWVYLLTALALFLPQLAVLVRRLHDTNHSGWWYWFVLVPLIGAIMIIVWLCSRGTSGNNDFGSDPFGGDLGTTFN